MDKHDDPAMLDSMSAIPPEKPHAGESANRTPCKGEVPQAKPLREAIRAKIREYVEQLDLVPPLSIEELRQHADAVLVRYAIGPQFRDFVTVLIGNQVWRNTVAGIVFERRVLMLPQCLRSKNTCPAATDDLGVLCEQCGQCATGDLQATAERLGYVVLVAEGTTVVTKLLQQGKVDAVIGVSCLSVLERAFPHMAEHAIPGLAIPLVRDGCDHCQVDLDWVRDAISLKSDARWLGRVDIDRLSQEVDGWFQYESLREVIPFEGTQTEEIALQWLAGPGKRWRPLLTACVFRALTSSEEGPLPESIRKVAIAMECFHKASLVHDDIEDEDRLRYGEKTLHERHGVPIALNVGDYLLGEGYRLVAACGAPPAQVSELVAVVAEGHRNLCLGQGEELCWMRQPSALTSRKVIELFRRKTAPAFEVALRLGAISGHASDEVSPVLKTFSESLGIAYQIRDDLEDFRGNANDVDAMRPSILHALAYESATGETKEAFALAWKKAAEERRANPLIHELMARQQVEEKARQLLEYYRNQAVRSLSPLRSAQLKSLLRRLVGKILDPRPVL